MGVYVDEVREYPEHMIKEAARRFGNKWSHMTADTEAELHEMARKIGLRREWCSDHTQPDSRTLHYDLIPSKRRLALANGAQFRPLLGRKTREKKPELKQGTLFDLGEAPAKLPD
jgi:hypothetical protein